MEVYEGDLVYLIVKVFGILEFEIMWYKSGELLIEDLRVKFIKDFDIGIYFFFINRVGLVDVVRYCCVVLNMGGLVVC